MAINDLKYGFYTSVGHDRQYENTDFNTIFSALITDGVFANVGDKFAVTPSEGMTVRVGTGRAWFDDTWTALNAAGFLTLQERRPNLDRIDAVVLTTNKSTRMNSISIVPGTASLSPVRPTMRNNTNVKDHPLAYINVNRGDSSVPITAADIQNVAPPSNPIVASADALEYLYSQWEANFETWFAHLQNELNSNQAANLQRQIDNINNTGLAKLATARLIDGVAFDGSVNIGHYGVCSSNSATSDKVVSIGNYSLVTGGWAVVKFANANSASLGSLTLNINSTGAKPIRHRGNVLNDPIDANSLYFVVYDGTNYEIIGGGIGGSPVTYTENKVLITDAGGSPTTSSITSTELGYLSGVTSNIKSSLDAKAPLASPSFTGTPTVAASTLSSAMVRNIRISTSAPSGTATNGTIWIKYKA